MKNAFALMILSAVTFTQAQTAPPTPAACASKSISFDVKLDSSQHALLPPESGKARVYFIQDSGPLLCLGSCLTARIGLDGTWIGANQNKSYFSMSVEPGEHHVCAQSQSHFPGPPRFMGLAHFTAEPGKTYYFRARLLGDKDNPFFDLDPIDSDQGEYMVAAFPLSISHPKR